MLDSCRYCFLTTVCNQLVIAWGYAALSDFIYLWKAVMVVCLGLVQSQHCGYGSSKFRQIFIY